MSSRSNGAGGIAAGAIGVVVVIGLLFWALNSLTSTDPGYLGLVRDGGPIDGTALQHHADGTPVIVPQASGTANIGLFSTLREYPVTPLYWRVDPDGGDTDQAVTATTADGYTVGVTGLFVFDQNTKPDVLAQFDDAYGSRPFGPNGLKPSDGTKEGTDAFLATFVPNSVQATLRQSISKFRCVDLVASCSLVQQNGQGPSALPTSSPESNYTKVNDEVNRTFEGDVNAQMGGPYLTHAKFALAKVSLPADLDAAVGRARAAFAQVSEAQARVQSAQADAQATQAKAQAYQNCPGCLTLDQTRALGDALAKLQPGAVFAPGGNGLNLNVPAVR
jgi:hypothetical protein